MWTGVDVRSERQMVQFDGTHVTSVSVAVKNIRQIVPLVWTH